MTHPALILCRTCGLCLLFTLGVRRAAAEESHARFLYPIAVQKTVEVPTIVLDVSEVADSPNIVKWAEDSKTLCEEWFPILCCFLATDDDYRERLHRHYRTWKEVVDDPRHPDHTKIRSKLHDDPSFRPAFPKQETVRREGPKVGLNDPCTCGSGKKFKRCCRP